MISKEKIKSSVDEAIELLKPVVKEVESSIPTTKNHYVSTWELSPVCQKNSKA